MSVINYANRGQGLETLIEFANAQYEARGIAQIQKVATPWKVIRQGSKIVSAFPEKKSTVDFLGVYKGTPLAFDAKSTALKTRFPYANVEKHQVDYMIKWEQMGGYAFFLIEFTEYNEIYFLPFSKWMSHGIWKGESIPYKWFEEHGQMVRTLDGIALHYLEHVEVQAK